MNEFSFVDESLADDFFPFTLTRNVADIRCGILTIRQKWQLLTKDLKISGDTRIPGNIIPDQKIVHALTENHADRNNTLSDLLSGAKKINNLRDILSLNASEISADFALLTQGRLSARISETNKLTGRSIFLEPGATVEHCYLNSSEGPVYIGKNAIVMEGSMIRGPFALGENALVKMGSKLYGAISAGPSCVLGGEIKNSILFGYSNKAHDGYLGDSVIGEWCNLGAGTTTSNLKNTGGHVKLWNPVKNRFTDAGLKCGLMMGDYSRSAIQTAFNSGTVTGVCCHIFGSERTPGYLPSFSWGSTGERYHFDKAIEHIQKWKIFKNAILSVVEINRLRHIFEQQNKN